MPQLQPGDFAPQLVWLAITFAILYFALTQVGLPRIEHVLTERKTRIGGDLERAREAQTAAQSELARYETEIAAARSAAAVTARSVREKLEAELGKQRQDLEIDLARKATDASARIHTEFERTQAQLQPLTAELAASIVKQLAGIDVTPSSGTAASVKE